MLAIQLQGYQRVYGVNGRNLLVCRSDCKTEGPKELRNAYLRNVNGDFVNGEWSLRFELVDIWKMIIGLTSSMRLGEDASQQESRTQSHD